jgi:hypothetical protein
MIKLRAKQDFTLKDYKKLKNIESTQSEREENKIYQNDVFECDEKMAKYLLGENGQKLIVAELLEVDNGNNTKKSK